MVPIWLNKVLKPLSAPARRPAPACARVVYCKPQLERLEDRLVPALAVTDLTMGITPTDLVNNLTGGSPNIAVSNIQYTGANVAAGTFTGGNGIIGFDTGIILSTGHANGVIGPQGDAGGPNPSFNNGQPGDPQLTALEPAGVQTFDASVLQFDFVPQSSTLAFQYVFGSEEYNEFVNAGFNDVFAFFLNGQNVSIIPGTNTPVSIDNVNLTTNPQFYINNADPTDPTPATPPLLNTQLDGLTVVLTLVVPVNVGQTNHIKLAIADAGDGIFDSDVFIRAGSFGASQINQYHPLRYFFTQPNPIPANTSPATISSLGTYDGDLTVTNIGSFDLQGPLFVVLPQLPPGVTLVNATGITPSGHPFIALPGGNLPANTAARVFIQLRNSNNVFLSTFFLDYPIELTNILV
jgi:hypothetical protein